MKVLLKYLLNNDYQVGILDEEIIKGKARLFYNDIRKLKNRSPLIIITGGKFEIETFLKYDEIGIEIIKKPFLLKDLINKIEYLNEKENFGDRTSFNFKIPLIDKTNKTKIIFDNSINKIINNNHKYFNIRRKWYRKKTNR